MHATNFAIIGSCGGVLRTGTYLDYRTDFTRNRSFLPRLEA